SPEKIARGERFFAKHGDRAVFLARFVVGVRAAVFLTSGFLRVSFVRFLIADFLAALLSVPFWIYLGYFLHANIEIAKKYMRRIDLGIITVIVLVVGFVLVRWYVKRRRAEKRRLLGALAEGGELGPPGR